MSGATPKALDIYHPDLAVNGINSVVLASFGGVVHDGKGGQTIKVKLTEYKPPKPKGGSPSGSKSNAKPKGPDPNQDLLDEIERLSAQFASTPWGPDTRTPDQVKRDTEAQLKQWQKEAEGKK